MTLPVAVKLPKALARKKSQLSDFSDLLTAIVASWWLSLFLK
jgi:hypothetical protein